MSPIQKVLASSWVTTLLTEQLPSQSRQHERQCDLPPHSHLLQIYHLSFSSQCCLGLCLICCYVLPGYHAKDALKGKILHYNLCHHVLYSSKLIFYFCCLTSVNCSFQSWLLESILYEAQFYPKSPQSPCSPTLSLSPCLGDSSHSRMQEQLSLTKF